MDKHLRRLWNAKFSSTDVETMRGTRFVNFRWRYVKSELLNLKFNEDPQGGNAF